MSNKAPQVTNLSPQEKRALLTQLLEKRETDIPLVYPLSYGQQALWFLQQLAPESSAYNEPLIWRLHAELNISAFQHALQILVDRHAALRTLYVLQGGQPVQKVQKKYSVACSIVDATRWSIQQLNEHLMHEVSTPIDLEHGPVFRAQLLTLESGEHLFMMITHHISIDTWSYMVLLDELGQLYKVLKNGGEGHETLPKLKTTYQDYVRWQLDTLSGQQGIELWAYWQQQLGKPLPLLQLPTDRPRHAVQTFSGAVYTFTLSEEVGRRLKKLAQTKDVTLYTLLLAAFQVLLYRYTGQEDILVNSPTNGRSRAVFDGVIGYFVNPVIMRANLEGNPPFSLFLGQVQQTVIEALAHQDYPFSLLIDHLQIQRDPSRSPLSDVAFVMEQLNRSSLSLVTGEDGTRGVFAQGATGAHLNLAGLDLELVNIERHQTKFDLELQITVVENILFGSLHYNTDLFNPSTIRDFAYCFETLLHTLPDNVDQRVAFLPILPQDIYQRILFQWNPPSTAHSGNLCLYEYIERQVELTPDLPAVIFQDQRLSYLELNRSANQLAHYLRTSGVGPEVRVGLYMDRSLEFIIGLLGIMKAGGVYIPLDYSSPLERLHFLLQDADLHLLLLQHESPTIPSQLQTRTIVLDRDWETIQQQPVSNLPGSVVLSNLAYIIYTSGSTGKPKGVMIEHAGIVNYTFALRNILSCTPGWNFALVSTPAADLGNTSIFCALTSGGCLHILPYEVATDGKAFADYTTQHVIDVVKIVPTHLRSLLATGGRQVLPQRMLILGGEALSWALIEQMRKLGHNCAVLNHYGPTETTIGVLVHQLGHPSDFSPERVHGETVPIGRPIENVQTYVLDQHLQPVPINVPGELYISGVALARGYWNQPELTRKHFIPHPFSADSDARMYRTGDIVRLREDGTIDFIGRNDYQVKIRGFRIELGEIEICLTEHPKIKECVVRVINDGDEADKRLVAYLIIEKQTSLPLSEIRLWLQEKLPDYMIPAVFIYLDALPIGPNGKLDRLALPLPEDTRPQLDIGYVAPQTEVESTIAQIWQSVLHLDQVGVHDNFFELGGNSLLMAEVYHRLQASIQGNFSLVTLFRYPSIRSFAAFCEQEQSQPNAFEEGSTRANNRLRQLRHLQKRRQEQRHI